MPNQQSVAILFDMDGVLVDSNPSHRIALREFCSKYGFELSDDELRDRIYGRTNREWLTNLFGARDEHDLKNWAEEKEALYRKLYENDIRPVAGLVAFLNHLDEHQIDRAIGTSAPPANVEFTLRKTGLGKYFKVILDETFVSRGKPDPEIYLKSAAALGYEPNRCIVIEDSLSGIAAGKAAGTKVIGITTTHTPEELRMADMVIDDFTALTVEQLYSLADGN